MSRTASTQCGGSEDQLLHPTLEDHELAIAPSSLPRPRGAPSAEVVRTYRRAAFQGPGDTVVFKTFALVRKPKRPPPPAEPLRTVKSAAVTKVRVQVQPLLSLEERIKARFANIRALDEEFAQRRFVRHTPNSKEVKAEKVSRKVTTF